MIPRRAASSATIALALGCLSWTEGAPPGRWDPTALPVRFVLASPQSRDLGAEVGSTIEVALRAWTTPACSAFRGTFAGVAVATAADDGINAIFVHEEEWPAELAPGVIAQTVVSVDEAGHLRDADIHLNGRDFRFSLDGAPGTIDAQSILVHELGHAIGLGHSSDPHATMAPNGSGVRWRSLEDDDRAGLCALYPGAGGPSCDEVPCPAPYLCVAGACQRPRDRRDVCSPCDGAPGSCEAAGDDARCVAIGDGETAGRVCGRACAADGECGAGFRCLATTEAGDEQCISIDGCASAASPCATDAECMDSLCRGGACVGPRDPLLDGGADAGPVRPASGAGPLVAAGPGCGCHLGGTKSWSLPVGLAVLILASVVSRFARPRARRDLPRSSASGTASRGTRAAPAFGSPPRRPTAPGDDRARGAGSDR